MKIFLLLLFIPFMNLNATLPEGALSLSSLKHGEIISVEGTEVEVQFTLFGCADVLGPVSYEFLYNRGKRKFILLISAINVHTEMSTRIRCFAPNWQRLKFILPIPVRKNRLELKFMKTLLSNQD